ncbi:MAG: NUDIX hydrolase [Candidatus Nanoarchaeia archaeon]|nr:NUDIX hydrolase [Candidatus Nanoarchaeia archaeon]MDD5239598.1 NUDIX hydrolase [Candidatus Nanoarchaeia archaeon]
MKLVKTIDDIERLCDSVRPRSRPRLVVIDTDNKAHINELESLITKTFQEGKGFKGDSVIKGISGYDYKDGVLYINQNGVLFPAERYNKNIDTDPDFGPTTGLILHCYDAIHGLYAMQIRGKAIDHANTIQVGAAGHGEYNEKFEETAMKELREELSVPGSLVLPNGTFLDAVPFNVHKKPNVAFTYIAVTDLSGLPYKENVGEIEEVIKLRSEKNSEVKNKFTVSLKNLGEIAYELEVTGLFLGPQARTVYSFIDWLNKQ